MEALLPQKPQLPKYEMKHTFLSPSEAEAQVRMNAELLRPVGEVIKFTVKAVKSVAGLFQH